MESERPGVRSWGELFLGVFGAVGIACSANPPSYGPNGRGAGGDSISTPSGGTIPVGGVTGVGGSTGKGGFGGGKVASDSRPVITAQHTPPPISGGTLLALSTPGRAVAGDPDRDRIVVVDTLNAAVLSELTLDAGDEPGRLVEDAAGRVHVALRGAGEVLSLDPESGELIERRSVCQAPRGIAFDRAIDAVVVACLEGTLVELPAAGGEALRTTAVAPDLRDVVFLGTTLVVTRFRSAEILYLDAERTIVKRVTPLANDGDLAATTAWRAVATPNRELFVTHQRALETSIDVGGGSIDDGAAGEGTAGTSSVDSPGTEGGYGSMFDPCSSIVQGTMTTATLEGIVVTHQTITGVGVPVNVAVSPTGFIAVANGAFDPTSPTLGSSTPFLGFESSALMDAPLNCGVESSFTDFQGTVTSVAFDADGNLLTQTREPSAIWIYDPSFTAASVIELGGANVTDTGHELFHGDTGSGMACASCHAEGTDDGHIWNFVGLGPRRTQPLDVGLEGTAPFHWDGELGSFGDLVHEVFQRRMGGPMESTERIAALESYVYGLRRRPAARAADDAAAVRGKTLFESEEIECATCHTGPKLTNGETKNIGRDRALQVPSLIGVSARAPFMHDGCAKTLRDRFDPACGGNLHGHPELLDAAELDDLVAYLESL